MHTSFIRSTEVGRLGGTWVVGRGLEDFKFSHGSDVYELQGGDVDGLINERVRCQTQHAKQQITICPALKPHKHF